MSAPTATGLTRDEAIAHIEAASSPENLFGHLTGAEAQREYRRLARLVHPDASPAVTRMRAASAFARLSVLWQQHREGTGVLVAAGDIANLIRVPGGLLKLARDPADGDLITREAAALRWLAAHGDPEFLPYVPVLIEARRYTDPVTGATRRGNVLREIDGFIGLDAVSGRYPGGLDPRDVAWIWRRLLVAVGFIHCTGLVHGAPIPPHVMIHPNDHGLTLIDFTYSSGGPNPGTLPAAVTRYRDWYPPEVGPGYVAAPDLDIHLATKTMVALIRPPVPAALAAFAAGCTLANPARRPDDAWQLLREFDDLIERLWGPRKFRPFPAM